MNDHDTTVLDSAVITIIIAPLGRSRFVVRLDGRKICESREPLLEAARHLLAEGFSPEAMLEMRHEGSPHVALRGKLGVAAKLTVEERPNGPKLVRWRGPGTGVDRPPMSFSDRPVPEVLEAR